MLNNYLTWRLVEEYVDDLSTEYVHASRRFYEAKTGRKDYQTNSRFCFKLIKNKLPEALSALFVRNHFGEESKSLVCLVYTLIFKIEIQLDWRNKYL